jgi:hypothetical protein
MRNGITFYLVAKRYRTTDKFEIIEDLFPQKRAPAFTTQEAAKFDQSEWIRMHGRGTAQVIRYQLD